VLAGSSQSALTAAASAAKTGFQTTISVPAASPYVEVQALNAAGSVIGSSGSIAVTT
jgi:hypothetical protein